MRSSSQSVPRVCHLTSVHSFRDTRIFLKECRSLAAVGYDTHLVAPGAPDVAEEGVSLHGIGDMQRSGRMARFTRTTRLVFRKAVALDADLYHLHDPELIPAGLVLRLRGKQVVYDAHEDLPRDLLSKGYLRQFRRPIAWALEPLENWAASRFSAVVAATSAIGARFCASNRRTVVVANYPILDEFLSVAPSTWAERRMAVGYIGGISVSRGVREMIHALECLAAVRPVTLDLAGSFKEVADRIAATRLPGWVFVKEHGILDRRGVAALLGSVRCGLIVWHPEAHQIAAQPIKLYEYMAAGIPVVASNFPLWREIVEGNECGVVADPLDPQAIAIAVDRLVTDDQAAERMGVRGRKAVRERYNWESEFEKLLGLYGELLPSDFASRRARAGAIRSSIVLAGCG